MPPTVSAAQDCLAGRRGAVVAAGVTLLVDQASKSASALAGPGLGGLNHPTRNTEFSLGLASAPWAAQVALMTVGLLIAGPMLATAVRRGSVPGWAAGLVLGGSVSNLVDRALLGSVRDFLHLRTVVLNCADIAVLTGVIAITLIALKGARARGATPNTQEGR